MRDIFVVAKFTMKEMVKKTSYILLTLFMLLAIIVGFNIPKLINAVGGSGEDELLIVDRDNVFEGKIGMLNMADSGYNARIGNESYEEIKQMINDEEISAAIIIEKGEDKPKVRYILDNITMMYGVPEGLINAFNSLYQNIQLEKLELTEAEWQSITPDFDFTLEQVEEEEVHGNILVMMIMSLVLFEAIYVSATQVAVAITTEKTSKIVETLATSANPKAIVLGKTLGIGLVGLAQTLLIIITALISAKCFLDPELLNQALDMSNITLGLGIITIIYFILGYSLYSLLYALLGSTISRQEDIQSVQTPATLLTIFAFYLAYFSMMNPTSNVNVFASLLPFSSPFCMPFRIMMGISSTSDVILSIVILVITTLVISKVAIKIYSKAILNYSGKLSIKDMIELYKSKN